MANIKFSDFTVGNTEGDIDFVVGYKGANNIQISPTNLLASALGNYLPLAGGTMTGSIILNDDVRLRAGTGSDFSFFHDGSNSKINNDTGNIVIENFQDDGSIIFKSDDGAGSTIEYLTLDGSTRSIIVRAALGMFFLDGVAARFGTSGDMITYHSGSHSYIENNTGDLVLINNADNKDIIFQCDDGSGGTIEYFRLDGSVASGGSVFTRFPDNSNLGFGNNADLTILHDSNHSYIKNYTGDLYVENFADDSDIIFKSDDGSGGVTNYIQIDGSELRTTFNKTIRLNDAIAAQFGGSNGMQIYHNNSNSVIQNITGNLTIRNDANDKDIEFACDDGSGGVTPYFRLDGSQVETVVFKDFNFEDSVNAKFGSSADLQIYHSGTASVIDNKTGNLYIKSTQTDGDIIFEADNSAGSVTEYFKLDGGDTITRVARNFRANDNVALQVGVDGDAGMYHDGTNTYIQNDTGDLIIRNNANDKDIIFKCDDGSGGLATYFFLDGSAGGSLPFTVFPDSSTLTFGTGYDLRQYHNGTDSYLDNYEGNLNIRNYAGDKDIIFKADDGSGGTAQYFRLDGGSVTNQFLKTVKLYDNVPLWIGDNNDLQIYHDGSNSYIKDAGTGSLKILGADIEISTAGGNKYFSGAANVAKLYHTNNEKLATTSTGIKISSVSEYADNTAAIAGGLTTGDVYRTGDLLKIVH